MKEVKIVQWIGTISYLVGMGMTSFNVLYPLNIFISCIGALCWLYAGIVTKNMALAVVEAAAALIYSIGIGYYLANTLPM